MTLIPYDHNHTYFSLAAAEKMANDLKLNGATDVCIWSRRDAFNQTECIVCWNT